MIDDKWVFFGIPIVFSAGVLLATFKFHIRNQRDIKGISQKQQTRHDDLLAVLRSSSWSDTKEKQDSVAKLK